jgi:hypothetical protein
MIENQTRLADLRNVQSIVWFPVPQPSRREWVRYIVYNVHLINFWAAPHANASTVLIFMQEVAIAKQHLV